MNYQIDRPYVLPIQVPIGPHRINCNRCGEETDFVQAHWNFCNKCFMSFLTIFSTIKMTNKNWYIHYAYRHKFGYI